MPETKKEVKPVLVEYICDVCGEGKMVKTERSYPMKPPKFEYQCNKCGEINNFFKSYPTVEYEEI